MDTSAWTLYNPNISVENTVKKYFGKYLYKIVVYAPAGRLIDSKGNIEQAFDHRIAISRNMSHNTWWGRQNKELERADIGFLNALKKIRHDHVPGIKLRVEEPRVQIYANSESALHQVIKEYFNPEHHDYIKSVHGPESSEAENSLNSGAILRKKDVGYAYKVVVRDGRYTAEVKKNILNYLSNLSPDVIKVPDSAVQMLSKTSGFIWNMYFYTNDPSILTFLNLIHPTLVSNYHELVVLDTK